MSSDVILIGADDVRRGGNAAREAGHEMASAANRIEYALQQHQVFLDLWLSRLEDILCADGGERRF